MKTYEVGVVTASPLAFAWRQVKSIFRTWLYARKHGYPTNKWYGIYETGTEIIAAQVGCLPGAEMRAGVVARSLNSWESQQGQRSA